MCACARACVFLFLFVEDEVRSTQNADLFELKSHVFGELYFFVVCIALRVKRFVCYDLNFNLLPRAFAASKSTAD